MLEALELVNHAELIILLPFSNQVDLPTDFLIIGTPPIRYYNRNNAVITFPIAILVIRLPGWVTTFPSISSCYLTISITILLQIALMKRNLCRWSENI